MESHEITEETKMRAQHEKRQERKRPRTYPQLEALYNRRKVASDKFRIALRKKGNFLLYLADIVIAVFEVDLLDSDNLLRLVVDAK